jgi:3-oxoacyl-[acyl-carrier protein] reductase
VTGATSGIGRAIALAAAAEGADIAITYRDRQDHARAVAENISALGRRCELFRFDLRDEASIGALVSGISSAFDHLDAWINNAGADLRGTILTSWAASRLLKQQPGGGVIVNMSWDHALSGMPGTNPEIFSAVKGGILSFSKSLARSVAPTVRVNVLAPGWIATAFADELKREQAERYREVAASTPLRRWGTPEDVAQAAVFLASPDAAFLTGQVLLVNGGVVM